MRPRSPRGRGAPYPPLRAPNSTKHGSEDGRNPLTDLVYRAVSYRGGFAQHRSRTLLDSKLCCCRHFWLGKSSKTSSSTFRASQPARPPPDDFFEKILAWNRARRALQTLFHAGKGRNQSMGRQWSSFRDPEDTRLASKREVATRDGHQHAPRQRSSKW